MKKLEVETVRALANLEPYSSLCWGKKGRLQVLDLHWSLLLALNLKMFAADHLSVKEVRLYVRGEYYLKRKKRACKASSSGSESNKSNKRNKILTGPTFNLLLSQS